MDRSEKRRQLAADRHGLSKGLNVRRRDPSDLAALMRVLHDLLRTSIQRQSVSPLMHWLYQNYTEATRVFSPTVEIACRRGCSHCCQMWVDASPAEVLYIAKQMNGGTKTRAAASVSKTITVTGSMSFDERYSQILSCPMLVGGECSVYATRPLACRSATSADAAICERAYNLQSNEQIPLPVPYYLVGSGYRIAIAGAAMKAGLRSQSVELNAGLNVAFATPDAEQLWLSGSDPFSAAPEPPGGGVFSVPGYREIYDSAFEGY